MLNEVRLIGRLGKDPELVEMGGKPMARLRIATTYPGSQKKYTTWHDVVVWGARAKACAEYLTKGRRVYIAGRMQTRSWKDPRGASRRRTEVVASNVLFLDKPTGGSPPPGTDNPTDPEDGDPWSGDPEDVGIPKDIALLLASNEDEDEPPPL